MFTVLHTESSAGWGGQENRILRESVGIRKLGARPLILCQPDSVLAKRAASEGIEVRTCRMTKSYDLFALRRILRLIKTESIDVISTHSGRDSLLAGIAGRISIRRPVIVRTRHLALPITSRITYSLLPDLVVTVSEYVRKYLLEEGVRPEKVVTVPTGIDLGSFDPDKVKGELRRELGISPDLPVVGTVAILRGKKGHRILLEAIPLVLEKVPEALFIFAGNGPQKKNLENMIARMGLSGKVLMLGLRKDIPNVLKSIDLFVLPTLQEALGTSFIEAMAMGKPVIGSRVGGVPEVIREGINGYLVAPNKPRSLAEAITDMLLNREKAGKMGEEGRRIACDAFAIEKMCKDMFSIYESLLERKKRG